MFDHKIFTVLGGVVDVVWISILWYVSSLLILTMGAASSAMYYTLHVSLFKNEGYLFSTYKRSFTDNLKKGTVVWVIFLLLDAFLVFDLILSRMAVSQGSFLGALYFPVLVCIVLAVMWQISAMTYQARFDDTVKNVLVKGAAVAMSNIGWMIFLAAILAGAIYLCRYLIFIAVILPGGYTCLVHHVFEHIYEKMGWIKEETDEELSLSEVSESGGKQ